MSRTLVASLRGQSSGEEIANCICRGIGLIAVIVSTPFLIVEAIKQSGAIFFSGVSIFAATMVLLYLSYNLYHALPAGKAKRVIRIIDHSAIFHLLLEHTRRSLSACFEELGVGHCSGKCGVLPWQAWLS